MKECDDPESNRTTAGFWLIGNLLAVMGSPLGISSTVGGVLEHYRSVASFWTDKDITWKKWPG
jgi:hypothetical protein